MLKAIMKGRQQALRAHCPNIYTVIFGKELRFIDANALKIIRLLGLLPPCLQRPSMALLFAGQMEHMETDPLLICT
jgi:hypothetical protein